MTTERVISQLAEASVIMLVGMVTVFVFLSLLIAAVKLLSQCCQYFEDKALQKMGRLPSSVEPENNIISAKQSTCLQHVPLDHVAAISTALQQHRKRHY